MIHWWNNVWLINWVAWLITDRLTVWMVDWLTSKLLNLLTDWLTFWMVDRWTDGLTNFVDVIIFIAIFCYFSPNCHVQLSNRYIHLVNMLANHIGEFVIILLFSTLCFCQWLSVLSIFRSIIPVIPLHYRMYLYM